MDIELFILCLYVMGWLGSLGTLVLINPDNINEKGINLLMAALWPLIWVLIIFMVLAESKFSFKANKWRLP